MILLTNAGTDKLQLTTGEARTIDVHTSWMDYSGTTVTPGRTNTAISTATTTDIVATPGASTYRNVKTINVRNKDSSSATITMIYDQNGTDYELHKVILASGECLEYIEGIGWFVVSTTAKLETMLRVTADITYSTAATFADITGLTVAVKNGKNYVFNSEIIHISAVATTGAQFGVNGPTMTYVIAATIDTVTTSVTGATLSAGAVTALNTAVTAQTSGSASNSLAHIAGQFTPSADGTFAMRATAEVAASMTVRQGSWLWVKECDN